MSKVVINIFEEYYLIANGLKLLFTELNNFDIEVKISNIDNLKKEIEANKTGIFILNTVFYENLNIELVNTIKSKNEIFIIGVRNFKDNFENEIFIDYIDYNENKISIEDKFIKILNKFKKEKPDKKPDNELSKREKSILELLAKGFINKEIAEKLFISIHTVTTHRKNIVKKLDIRTLSGLTVYAILNKIVNMNDLK